MSAPLRQTPDTTIRYSSRASVDREAAYRVLDEALVAHVGFVLDGRPFVIPMVFGRDGDRLLLHGSVATRLMRALDAGAEACVTVTLLDGLVLARSQFHHSMNYRCVVMLGTATRLRDENALEALGVIVDHASPGRSREARPADRRELRETMVLAMDIDEASLKVRDGGVLDDPEDIGLDVWAGVVPLAVAAGEPVPDAGCESVPLPSSIARWTTRPQPT